MNGGNYVNIIETKEKGGESMEKSAKPKKQIKKRRSQVKNPYLKKQYNSRVRQEYLDADYTDNLSPELREYYNKFIGEFYGADLNFEDLSQNLHNTEELKKDCTDRNNAQNRCQYGIAKAGNKIDWEKEPLNVDYAAEPENEVHSDPNIEDALINYIDSKKEGS